MKQRLLSFAKQPYYFAQRRPIISFLVLLALLLGLIILGNSMRRSDPEPQKQDVEPKKVEVVTTGASTSVESIGEVTYDGVISISAQTAGVVSKLYVQSGTFVKRGDRLAYLSSAYNGSSAATLQADIAQKQYEQAKETLPLQLDLIGKQRESARLAEENAADLREITREVLINSQNAANDTAEALRSVNFQIEELEENNADGSQDTILDQLNQAKLQLSSSLVQLRSGVTQSEYSSDEDNPPAELSTLQRETAMVQLDVQERTARLQVEVAKLQYQLAQVQVAIAYPTAPVSGMVERVFVSPYATVQPGTLLFVIKANEQQGHITAKVDQATAMRVSTDLVSNVVVDEMRIGVKPTYVSTIPTEGNQFSVILPLDEEDVPKLQGRSHVRVNLTLDGGLGSSLLPLESVYQMEERSDVFVVVDGKAVSREVKLGQVIGNMVEVLSGIGSDDHVILDRAVLEGERVEPTRSE